MTKMEIFFGSQAQNLLSVYRRYRYLQSIARSLEDKQAQLEQQSPDKSGNGSKKMASITYQKEVVDSEIKRLDNYINDAIQKTVKNTPLEVLQKKLEQLTPHFESDKLSSFFDQILEVKKKLGEMDILSHLLNQSGKEADFDFTYQRIQSAVEQSLQRKTTRVKGNLEMRGNGTTHVEQDDAMVEVAVSLSGVANATFNFESIIWNNKPIAKATQEEAKRWLNLGRRKRHKQNLDGVMAQLSSEIQQMTDSLRQVLEE